MTHIREQYLITIEDNGDLVMLETHTSIHPEIRLSPEVWQVGGTRWFLEARSALLKWIDFKSKELQR